MIDWSKPIETIHGVHCWLDHVDERATYHVKFHEESWSQFYTVDGLPIFVDIAPIRNVIQETKALDLPPVTTSRHEHRSLRRRLDVFAEWLAQGHEPADAAREMGHGADYGHRMMQRLMNEIGRERCR